MTPPATEAPPAAALMSHAGLAFERVQERRSAWRVAIVMHALAALTLLVVLPAPDPDPSDHGWLLACAGIQAASAVAVGLLGPRAWVVRASPLSAILVVSLLVAVARPMGATPFFYLWPLLHAAYFLSRADLAVAMATTAITYAVALAWFAEPELRVVMWTGAMVSSSLVAVLVHGLKTRSNRLLERLHRGATTDPLTGLVNRRAFEEVVGQQLERSKRSGAALSLAVFDLDHFKRINDMHGHARGDEALRCFAGVLSERTRVGDVAARTGGEEFAVMLPDTDQAGARSFAEGVLEALHDLATEDDVRLAASAGVVERVPGLDSLEALSRAGDEALYAAKGAGRARVMPFRASAARPSERGD